jgi:pimeloyl-ACP methyl ester carboxylesterase
LLQPRQYESYADALRKADIATWIQTGDDTDTANDNTAAALHRDAAAVLARNAKHASVVLIGHSRGGAVAAIAATDQNGMKSMKTPPLLVLLDPVDTTPPTALPLISAPTSATHPPPVLVVSLPYGGYSSFYKTYYASACAPALRNGDSFAEALSQRSPAQRVLQVP